MTKEIRAMEAERAYKLQEALGADYEIDYDSCESGLIRCYYKRILYKTVENSAMSAKTISVTDYAAPAPLLTGFITTQEQYDRYFA